MADSLMRAAVETSAIVPEKWSANFFDALLVELAFEALISKDYEGEIQDLGDTVNISTVPEFDDAGLLDEDGRADAEAVTITGQQLVINKRAYKDFIVTRRAVLQSLPMMDKLQDLSIYSLLKKMQREIIDAIAPVGANAIAYDAGTTLALADLLEGKELLDAANVPGQGRWMVTGSAQTNDIFNITNFTSSDFLLSGAPTQTGEVPSALLGFQPRMTNEAGAVTYLFHGSFMTVATQDGMRVQQYDLGVDGKRATRVNVDTLFGLKQLDGNRVVTIS